MKKYTFRLFWCFVLVFVGVQLQAQEFNLDAQVRPRFEYRHGFQTLPVDTLEAAGFISQRTRLNLAYGSDMFEAKIAMQNIRTWGDVATNASADKNGIAIHEAWATLILTEAWRFKFGRQVLAYDDERVFGGLDWAQQARSHDAAILGFSPSEKLVLEAGFALNANGETRWKEDYQVNQYKNLQFLHYNGSFGALDLSALFMNQGLPYDDQGDQELAYNQTFGARGVFAKSHWNANASLYAQTGDVAMRSLGAWNAAANFSYSFSNGLSIGLGTEYLSGTDMDATDNKLKSFTPWFGTNHKFNGLMDYFYVGNHTNSVGLLDMYLPLGFKTGKFKFNLTPHIFSSAANIVDTQGVVQDDYLGTEIDFTFSYAMAKWIGISGGYSQMFAGDSMEVLKGGDKDATANWAWLMINVTPKLFSTKK